MFCLLRICMDVTDTYHMQLSPKGKNPNAVVKVKSIFWKAWQLLSQNAFSNSHQWKMGAISRWLSFFLSWLSTAFSFFILPINLCYLSCFFFYLIIRKSWRTLRSSFLTGPKINNCQKEVANYPSIRIWTRTWVGFAKKMIRMMQSYSKVHQWGENNLEVEIELFTQSSSSSFRMRHSGWKF